MPQRNNSVVCLPCLLVTLVSRNLQFTSVTKSSSDRILNSNSACHCCWAVTRCKFVDNQSVGNTINNSISRPSDERTVPLCGPTRPGASSPPRYIYLSGSDDAIEQWTGGRGDGIAGGSEEQRERIDRASRSGGATRRVSTDSLMGKNETLQLRFSG